MNFGRGGVDAGLVVWSCVPLRPYAHPGGRLPVAIDLVDAMTALGVSESQIEAVSLGKEKPKAEGHNEEAWAQNRRADIVYK